MGSEDLEEEYRNRDQATPTNVSLGQFIDKNSRIFLVMGVFAALSVYISNMSEEGIGDQYVQVGLVSSILITFLLSLVILWNLKLHISDYGATINDIFNVINMDVMIFTVFYIILLYAIGQIITQETRALVWIGLLVVMLTVIIISATTIRVTNQLLSKHIDNESIQLGISSFIVCVVVYYVILHANSTFQSNHDLVHPNEWDSVAFTETFPTIGYMASEILIEIAPLVIMMAGMLFVVSLIEYLRSNCRDMLDDLYEIR